jgi:hypothetical protein
MFKNIIPMALKAGIIKKVNKKKVKKKNIKTKNPMRVKYSTFKQKSIINRQISNSRNFFKNEDK